MLGLSQSVPAAAGDQPGQPGRRVKVAAIAIGYGGDHDQKLKLAVEHLETAGRNGVDIACLPEEFAGTKAEPIPGPTTNAVGELAKKYHMYVVCPIREQAAGGRQYNTAVLLDRAGKVAGRYRKVFVFWGENGVSPSTEGVQVFDADFGRIALLTCFDANFDEVWQEAERKGAEMVLWPSAYGGGLPLERLRHDPQLLRRGRRPGQYDRHLRPDDRKRAKNRARSSSSPRVDLDLTLVHTDFTGEKVAKLLREHKGEVELVPHVGDMEGWFVLRAVKPGVRVRNLCKQYQIETLREYRHRSRQQIDEQRRMGRSI